MLLRRFFAAVIAHAGALLAMNAALGDIFQAARIADRSAAVSKPWTFCAVPSPISAASYPHHVCRGEQPFRAGLRERVSVRWNRNDTKFE
jgi:hypothetical protein